MVDSPPFFGKTVTRTRTDAIRPSSSELASAVDSFRECVGKAPNNAACQYHLGLSYSKIGDPRSARVALEQGLKLNPAAPEATEAKTVLATLASR